MLSRDCTPQQVKSCVRISILIVLLLQNARALAAFSVDEVVIFDQSEKAKSESNSGLNRKSDPNILLARILQYLECPQYLRKNFFPKHSDLQYAGTCTIHTCACKINDMEFVVSLSSSILFIIMKRQP